MPPLLIALRYAFCVAAVSTAAAKAEPVQAGQPAQLLRGAIPRAQTKIQIDGNLQEYDSAFCTPVEYFHSDVSNRAAQFFYLWDDEAFYVGLRTLDQKTYSPEHPLWEGDAVEWYFDTRQGTDFRSTSWPKGPAGAVHCFFTPMLREKLRPRFCLRPGFEHAIPAENVKVEAKRTAHGLEVEFKLPWDNFSPQFQPAAGKMIALDAELSYSDGGPRSDRSFVFGSPLSVWQPANLAAVQLVEEFETQHWSFCGPVMMPLRVDVPWNQKGRPEVVAQVAMPPNRAAEIGKVEFVIFDLKGKELARFCATEVDKMLVSGGFERRLARWPATLAAPGSFQVTAIVYSNTGEELTRIAPRMVSVNMQSGY